MWPLLRCFHGRSGSNFKIENLTRALVGLAKLHGGFVTQS